MKKLKKILIIVGIVIGVLLAASLILRNWLENYSVKMNKGIKIPKPVTKLNVLDLDSSDWPSWKGITANNYAGFTNIKTDWSKGLEKLWEVDYLCKGNKSITWSCPVIKGNHLVVPGRHETKDVIFCLNPENGDLLWYKSFEAPPGNTSYGEGSRATPTIDNDRVYTLSRGGLLQCWDLYDGSNIWKHDFIKLGGEIPKWGFSGSPLVYKDNVYVQVGNKALIIAFNKNTGKIVWESKPAPASYSTPVVIKYNNEEMLLSLGGEALFALDLISGSILWETPWSVMNYINICTPIYSQKHGIVVISSWYKKGIEAVKINRNEGVVLWHNKLINAHQADPFILDDHIYGYSGMSAHNNEDFKCLDLQTGNEKWSSSDLGSGQFIYIKPYFLSLDIKGNLYLSLADPNELKVISKIEKIISVDNARAWTKPIVARGKLYLRYVNKLFCYDITNK